VLSKDTILSIARDLDYDPGPTTKKRLARRKWAPWLQKVGLSTTPILDRAAKRHHIATVVIETLGPDAAPAIPVITNVMYRYNFNQPFGPGVEACSMLRFLGTNGLSALMQAAADPAYGLRWHAVDTIGLMFYLTTNANPAVPLLVSLVGDKDPNVAASAVRALGRLHLQPETTVPVLTTVLSNQDPWMRIFSMRALARFGSAARSATPLVVPALSAHEDYVRREAKDALFQIAPDLLTNTPAK
jgi:hypothetical protein